MPANHVTLWPVRNSLAIAIAATSLATSLHAAEPARLETVLVRAQQVQLELEAQQKLVPGGVTLIDGEDLQQRNMTTMADMLRYVPGIWVASGSTADSTFFSSRGSNLDATNYDGNGIKLMQDGLPITGADGNNHNRDVDPLSARYVVVARGANALTYGASTLGGAIDFITPTAHDTPSQLYVTGGSDGQVEGRVTAGTVAGQFDGLITAEARRYDGYREHQEQEREALYANAGWQFSDAVRTRLYLTYIDNDQELPGGLTREQWRDDPEQAEAEAVEGDYQYNVETWRIADKTTWDINENSSLSFGLSYEEQELYHPIVYGPFFSLRIETEQKNAGASLRYNLRAGNHDLLAGVNYGETRVTGANYFYHPNRPTDLMADVDNTADNTEIFLVDRWQFAPQWTLLYGAQGVIGTREASNTDAEGDYDSINPRVGVIYQVTPGVELFSNISKLYEAPTLYQLEDGACQCAEALDAMQGYVFEIGTRGSQPFGKANEWHWEVAAYYAQLQDEILSIDGPEAGSGDSLATNIDDTLHAGIEALFGASFALGGGETHRIEPLLNITINDFSFDDDATYNNNDLPVAPGYFIKGEILYRHASGFFAGPTFDIVDERYADFANTYTLDSYELLGLRAGFTQQKWEVWAELRNLTDEDYIGVVSVKDVAAADDAILYPGESRSASVGVRFEF